MWLTNTKKCSFPLCFVPYPLNSPGRKIAKTVGYGNTTGICGGDDPLVITTFNKSICKEKGSSSTDPAIPPPPEHYIGCEERMCGRVAACRDIMDCSSYGGATIVSDAFASSVPAYVAGDGAVPREKVSCPALE
jgi:hypothetical protein